jgi:ketosteroid isomerase-like protein
MTIEETLREFRLAATEMARGNPAAVKALYSDADDITLANPFGHAVRGRADVFSALDFVATRFSDGEVREFDTLARYESPELATFIEVEHWRTRIAGGDVVEFDLRVSSTYRNEEGTWKLVSRHADPISTFDEAGPVRRTM